MCICDLIFSIKNKNNINMCIIKVPTIVIYYSNVVYCRLIVLSWLFQLGTYTGYNIIFF